MSLEKYLKEIRCLRKALDVLEQKMEQEIATPSSQRQRRNLKAVRVENHEVNYALGTWKKPTALKNKQTL